MGVQEGQGGGILKQFKNLKIKMRGDRNTLGDVDVVMRELERREWSKEETCFRNDMNC